MSYYISSPEIVSIEENATPDIQADEDLTFSLLDDGVSNSNNTLIYFFGISPLSC